MAMVAVVVLVLVVMVLVLWFCGGSCGVRGCCGVLLFGVVLLVFVVVCGGENIYYGQRSAFELCFVNPKIMQFFL